MWGRRFLFAFNSGPFSSVGYILASGVGIGECWGRTGLRRVVGLGVWASSLGRGRFGLGVERFRYAFRDHIQSRDLGSKNRFLFSSDPSKLGVVSQNLDQVQESSLFIIG